LPLIRECVLECREVTLYALGLVYSSNDNQLGQYIGKRVRHWAGNLALPERAITSYLRWTEHAWDQTVQSLTGVALGQGSETLLTLKPWGDFLEALQTTFDSEDVGRDLKPLQERAALLLEALDRSRRFSEVPAMLRLIPDEAHVDLGDYLRAPRRNDALEWIERNRATLEGLLGMVARQAELSPAAISRMTLPGVVSQIDKLLASGSSEVFTLELNRRFSFARQRWTELIAHGTVEIFVHQPGYPFLPREVTAPAEGAINGDASRDLYHRNVVEGSVRPALDEFVKLLHASALRSSEKSILAAYALEQVNAYADHYRQALLAEPYQLNVRSAYELLRRSRSSSNRLPGSCAGFIPSRRTETWVGSKVPICVHWPMRSLPYNQSFVWRSHQRMAPALARARISPGMSP
jgi:hypothetical protein